MAAWADFITSSVCSMLMFQFTWTEREKEEQFKSDKLQEGKAWKLSQTDFAKFTENGQNTLEQHLAGQQSDIGVTHRPWKHNETN